MIKNGVVTLIFIKACLNPVWSREFIPVIRTYIRGLPLKPQPHLIRQEVWRTLPATKIGGEGEG